MPPLLRSLSLSLSKLRCVCRPQTDLLLLNCIQIIRIVRVHNEFGAEKSLSLPLANHEWNGEIYKPILNWNWNRTARDPTEKNERKKIFDFLQMSNDHYRNKFQKETRKSFQEGGENRRLLLLLPLLLLLWLLLVLLMLAIAAGSDNISFNCIPHPMHYIFFSKTF